MDTTGGYQSLLGLTSINSNSSTIDVLDVENITINGVIDLSQAIVGGLTTSQVDEGLNLYYTDTRVNNNSNVSSNTTHRDRKDNPHAVTATQVGINSTDDIIEGVTNLYYTDIRFDDRLATKTTTSLAEGSNLYYTDARFDTRFGIKTTTDLTEGTNLYYTDARFDTRFGIKTTTDLAEGTNLYYTDARFDTRLATKTTTNLTEGTNLYYTTTRANADFDTRFGIKTTTDLTEGTNLYYTEARVSANTNVSANTAKVSADGSIDTHSDVSILDVQDQQFLKYSSFTQKWANVTPTTAMIAEGTNLYYTDARFDTRFATKTTTNLTEGTNLYYTEARFDTSFGVKKTTDLTEGINLYYTDARFDTRFGIKTTTNLTEGSNLYYTEARVSANTDVKANSDYRAVGHLPLSGGTLTGNLNMGNYKIISLATPTADTDGANKKYIDDKFELYEEGKVLAERYSTTAAANNTAEMDAQFNGKTPNASQYLTNLYTVGWSGDYFGVIYNCYLYVPTDGNVTFRVRSDDSSDWFIDDALVASNYGAHGVGGAPVVTSTVFMTAGFHKSFSRFIEYTGGEGMIHDWDLNGGSTFTTIPTSNILIPKLGLSDITDIGSGAIITTSERANIATNTAKVSYPSADSTKVGFISVTQAVNLDTMESDIKTNSDYTAVGHLPLAGGTLSGNLNMGNYDIDNVNQVFIDRKGLANNKLVLYDNGTSSTTDFYGFGIQSSTLVYNVNATASNHKFYYLGTNELFRIGNAGIYSYRNLDVTGNITLSGTVDGVDVAALNTSVVKLTGAQTVAGIKSFSSRIQVTGNANPSSGIGVELGYTGTAGIILSYDRGGGVYKDIRYNALSHSLESSGIEVLNISSTGVGITGNITVSGTVDGVDLKALESAVSANTAKVSYPSADSTKVGFISVTQAVNLDTMESDIATNNNKISYTDATKVGFISVTQAVNLDTMETDITSNNAYRNVGHLPLGGGTMTGDITMGGQVPVTYSGPIMTSATAPAPYVITASSSLSAGSQYLAFDGKNFNAWESTPNTRYDTSTGIVIGTPYARLISGVNYYGEWIQVDLGANYIIPSYGLDPSNTSGGAPKSWAVGISTNGSTFTLLDRKIDQTYAGYTTFTPATSIIGRYIVMSIDRVSGNAGKAIITVLKYTYETLNYSIYNLKEPTDSHYAATKGYVDSVSVTQTYVDTQDATKLALSGGTMTGNLNMGNYDIDNVNQIFIDRSAVANNKIVLYDGGTPSTTAFYGFGIQSATLLYNVDASGANHKFFYGGTNEVFRMGNSGVYSYRDLDVKGNIILSGTVDGIDIQSLNTTVGGKLSLTGGTMSGNLDMGGYNINTVGTVDGYNLDTLNTNINNKLPLTGGTVTGNLTNTGFFNANAGSKLVVQNSMNGGNSRGIFMWNSGDTNWGIYMAQSGSGRALNNGIAPAWNFSSYAIRFRVYNASDTGFIWERSDNNAIASLNCSGVFQSRGPYSNVSDRRQKENFGETFGLEFINKLKPLSFSMIYDDEKQIRHGLIAQDVEEVLAGYDLKFSGLQAVKVKIPNPDCKYKDEPTQCTMLETDEIEYTLAYSEFIAPLIKAVQELSAEVVGLKNRIEILEKVSQN